MKVDLVASLIILGISQAITSPAQTEQFTIKLQPIIESNGRYFYDSKRMNFDALYLPMSSLNDSQVNSFLRKVKILRSSRNFLHAGSLLYVLTRISINSPSSTSSEGDKVVLISALSVGLGIAIFERLTKKKAISRYNSIIFNPKTKLGQKYSLGIGINIGN